MAGATGPEACAAEPIHIPGSVQDFGVLLALGPDSKQVVEASVNAAALWGRPILGVNIVDLFAAADAAALETALTQLAFGSPRTLRLTPRAGGDGLPRAACLHKHAGVVILEVELPPLLSTDNEVQVQMRLGEAVDRLYSVSDNASLYAAAVTAIRDLSGVDRAMLYRFDDDAHGEVVAESRSEALPSYLGQHFPASDIPPQARQVFCDNWLRMIPDRSATPVPLERIPDAPAAPPLDLGRTLLRAVSPVHLAYLDHMGVAASLTVSVKQGNRLWGLLACHHRAPLFVSQAARQACAIVGRLVSSLLTAREADAEQARVRRVAEVTAALRAQMGRAEDFAQGLVRGERHVLELLDAHGAAAFNGSGRWALVGRVPPMAHLHCLVAWLAQKQHPDGIFATDRLPAIFPDARHFAREGTGLLAVMVPKSERAVVLFFRPEVTQTVTWAGDPNKAVGTDGAATLHPRASFARWLEVVHGRSLPWRPDALQAAARLRETIIEVDLARQVRRERHARAESEAQRQRLALLAAASAEIATSLDVDQCLDAFANLAAARFCDWTAIYRVPDVVEGSGGGACVRRIVRHRTAQGQALLDRLLDLPPLALAADPPIGPAADGQQGRATLVARVDGAWLGKVAPSPEYVNFLRDRVGMASLLIAPVLVRGQCVGALKFVRTRGQDRFGAQDALLAEELARRVGQSLDNARLYASAQRALAARDHLMGVVSHDLKNPLGAVELNVQSIQKRLQQVLDGGGHDVESLARAADRIALSARRMRGLVEDVLNVTRVEAGTLLVDRHPVPVGQLVDETCALLAPLAAERGQSLVTAVDAPESLLACDAERLLQVFSNLVGNAIKFTPPEGTIVVEARPRADEVAFRVRDDGPGIDAAALPHVFDRFWQGRSAARRQGAGLGLAIARGIVEAHGGRIWVESTQGEGTTFTFVLPRGQLAGRVEQLT